MTAEWLAISPHCRIMSCVVSQQAIGDKPYVLFARGPVLEAFIESIYANTQRKAMNCEDVERRANVWYCYKWAIVVGLQG